MASFERYCADEAKAVGTGDDPILPAGNVLEVPFAEGVIAGCAFEEAEFRHLTQAALDFSRPFPKVVITHDGRRRVVKVNGFSTAPYEE